MPSDPHRFRISSSTCFQCQKMTAGEWSHSPTRTTSSPSGECGTPPSDMRRHHLWIQPRSPVSVRHHTYKKTDHRNVELTEVGPRFEMKRKFVGTSHPSTHGSSFKVSVFLFSVHDQTGNSGKREHSRGGVASARVHTHGQEEEVPQRAVRRSSLNMNSFSARFNGVSWDPGYCGANLPFWTDNFICFL